MVDRSMTNPKDPRAELRERIYLICRNNKEYEASELILALFQAAQQQLITEVLGALPKKCDNDTKIDWVCADAHDRVIDKVTEVLEQKLKDLGGQG